MQGGQLEGNELAPNTTTKREQATAQHQHSRGGETKGKAQSAKQDKVPPTQCKVDRKSTSTPQPKAPSASSSNCLLQKSET